MLKFNKIILFYIMSSNLFAHGISDADKHEMTHGALLDYLYLGAKHMITGYDHILFLIGVIFFLTRFSDIIKFITAFTIGHSLTLFFATLFNITANYYLVDAVIALSVIYKGFENLNGFKWISIKAPNVVMMVFVFGLIHGFGLSTRLQQLNLSKDNFIYSILSFNVGVELGQVVVLSIIFPLLIMIRGNIFEKISKISNFGLIIAGIFLFIFQMVGFVNHSKEENKSSEMKYLDLKDNQSTKENDIKHEHNDHHKHHGHTEDDHHHGE